MIEAFAKMPSRQHVERRPIAGGDFRHPAQFSPGAGNGRPTPKPTVTNRRLTDIMRLHGYAGMEVLNNGWIKRVRWNPGGRHEDRF
jgi:hypothetical protein